MPRKKAADDDWGESIAEIPDLPPRRVNGRPNVEHYRARYALLSQRSIEAQSKGERFPDLKNHLELLKQEVEIAGFRFDEIEDQRTPEEKLVDFVRELQQDPESVLEKSDELLEQIKRGCEKAVALAETVILKDRIVAERILQLGKAVARLVEVALQVRAMVREEHPACWSRTVDQDTIHAIRATRLLRFLLYVMRNQETGGRGAKSVLKFAEFHAEIAWDIYKARNGIAFRKVKREFVVGAVAPKEGIVIFAPPGHGKTVIATGATALEMSLNPDMSGIYLHAVSDQSTRALGMVAGMFDPKTSDGRRRASLYPAAYLAEKGNTQGKITLWTGRAISNPTMAAYGVMTGVLGAGVIWQVWDDVVPQTDAYQEADRAKRRQILMGTYMSRQRKTGRPPFVLCVCNLWHPDDAVSNLIKAVRKGEINWAVSMHGVGGPDTRRPFFPVWPDVWSEARLRARYSEMKDPTLWAAAYMGKPIASSGAMVRDVGRFDPDSVDHREFMRTARMHLSLDPAGTNRRHSDRAGFLYIALGDCIGFDDQGNRVMETRARILDAMSLRANQTELVEHTLLFARGNRVDEIHVEVAGGFHATADLLDQAMQGTGLTVNRLPPGVQDKAMRLRNCSHLIEAQRRHGDVAPRNVVEFPLPDPDGPTEGTAEELVDQLQEFGSTKNDHLVDALTQVLNYWVRTGQIRPGEGKITRALTKYDVDATTRVSKWVRQLFKGEKRKNENTAEAMFVSAGGRV